MQKLKPQGVQTLFARCTVPVVHQGTRRLAGKTWRSNEYVAFAPFKVLKAYGHVYM